MSRRSCPPSEALAAYVDGRSDAETNHISSCADCSDIVRILSELRAGDAVEEVAGYLDDLDALLVEIENIEEHRLWFALREARFLRLDLIRRLLAKSWHARWRDPRLACHWTAAATAIIDRLNDGGVPLAELRFQSWSLHGAWLRESGRYQKCREALVRAEAAARDVIDSEMAEATVRFGKALLASEPDVWEPGEARTLLDEVEAFFSRRSRERWRRARTARATLLYREGDGECARIYQEVLDETPRDNAAAYRDALFNSLIGRVEHGDTSPELDAVLDELEGVYRETRATACVARCRWLRGKLFALRAEHDAAVECLRTAADLYTELGDEDSSVRVGLDEISSMLTNGEYEEAAEHCRRLAETARRLDEREPSRRRTLTAQVMAYARELSSRSMLTTDVLAKLRSYVDQIHRQRPVAFVPPMPPHTV